MSGALSVTVRAVAIGLHRLPLWHRIQSPAPTSLTSRNVGLSRASVHSRDAGCDTKQRYAPVVTRS